MYEEEHKEYVDGYTEQLIDIRDGNDDGEKKHIYPKLLYCNA